MKSKLLELLYKLDLPEIDSEMIWLILAIVGGCSIIQWLIFLPITYDYYMNLFFG